MIIEDCVVHGRHFRDPTDEELDEWFRANCCRNGCYEQVHETNEDCIRFLNEKLEKQSAIIERLSDRMNRMARAVNDD